MHELMAVSFLSFLRGSLTGRGALANGYKTVIGLSVGHILTIYAGSLQISTIFREFAQKKNYSSIPHAILTDHWYPVHAYMTKRPSASYHSIVLFFSYVYTLFHLVLFQLIYMKIHNQSGLKAIPSDPIPTSINSVLVGWNDIYFMLVLLAMVRVLFNQVRLHNNECAISFHQ